MDVSDPFLTGGKPAGGLTLTPRQIVAILWAYKTILIVVPLVAAVLAAVYIKFRMERVYAASSTLMVAFKADDPSSGGNLAELGAWSFIPTQIEFIQSPSTLMPVVEKLKLWELPEYTANYVGDGSQESVRQFVVWKLKSKISVSSGRQSRFLYISAEDRNPVVAATLANEVADAYLDAQMRQLIDPAKERLARYSGKLDALRANIDAAQVKIAAFRQRTGLVNVGSETDAPSVRLVDLESRLNQATAARQEAEQNLGRVQKGDAAVLNSALVQSLKGQLQQKEAQMVELRGTLGPRHPSIVSLQLEMNELREQLGREVGVHADSARSALASASSIEAQLRQQISDQRDQVMKVRMHQDEAASLLQELESATKVYQTALDSVERAQLATQMAVSTVSIVDRATPPAVPKGTRRKLFVVICGGAAGGTLALCLLYELLNRRVRCREDIENDLGTPVLVELRSPV